MSWGGAQRGPACSELMLCCSLGGSRCGWASCAACLASCCVAAAVMAHTDWHLQGMLWGGGMGRWHGVARAPSMCVRLHTAVAGAGWRRPAPTGCTLFTGWQGRRVAGPSPAAQRSLTARPQNQDGLRAAQEGSVTLWGSVCVTCRPWEWGRSVRIAHCWLDPNYLNT